LNEGRIKLCVQETMNEKVMYGILAATSLALVGCQTADGYSNNTGTGALLGGALGAAAGAIIGNQSGHGHGGGSNAAEGALIGGAFGAITGGLIGSSMDQEQRARLRAQAPQTYQRIDQGQPLGVADVKALARAGVSDDVIISQIRNSRTVYRLTAPEIIELHEAGVSPKVIEFMINTPTTVGGAASAPVQSTVVVASAPPPPPVETIVVAPGPGYVWVGGEWEWHGRWVWVGGHWVYPPRPHVVWVSGTWYSGPRGWCRRPGYWR